MREAQQGTLKHRYRLVEQIAGQTDHHMSAEHPQPTYDAVQAARWLVDRKADFPGMTIAESDDGNGFTVTDRGAFVAHIVVTKVNVISE